MKAKRIASLLLAGSMTVSLAACGGQSAVTNNAEETSSAATSSEATSEATAEAAATSTRPTEPSGQLVIGTTTPVENDFYDVNFNVAATNYRMYDLINGYATLTYTKEGQFEFDPTVVASHEETDNEDGTKTYTVTINDGLVWSDGTPITAKDYVFAALLENSDEMGAIDGYGNTGLNVLVGWDEYSSGESDTFAGVHLVDDMTYSVTIKAEELPNHYDITYASLAPRPMSVIAPGCDVEETENGAQITGDFSTELLQETINNADTGYRYHPNPTCGPYTLTSYDTASREAVLTVNPNYAGDYRGVKPVIETLVIRTVSNDTMMNELEAGSVDLLFECSGGDTINAGLDLVEAGTVTDSSFYRNGYGKLEFDCSVFPTDSENVRKAIAYCLDRNEFARQYTGGYGTVVHSYYGLAQWEYEESKDWINENLNTYEPNVDKAIELLEADGWTLGEDGQPYSGTGLRYKEVDGELKPLVIEWANTDGNPVSTLLATMLPESMEAAGMKLNATTMDFTTLQNAMLHSGDKIYNMYNLATGFALASSPWYYYSKDPVWMQGGYNSNWIADDELDAVTQEMKSIPFDDREAWLTDWREFIKLWNDRLPDIPLYSDEYYDFFAPKLQNWDATPVWSWTRAVLDASIG